MRTNLTERGPAREGITWLASEITRLMHYARIGLSTWEIARCLERTEASVRAKAAAWNISLQPPDPKKALPTRRGKEWSYTELGALRTYTALALDMWEIAQILQRTETGVRLKMLDLDIRRPRR